MRRMDRERVQHVGKNGRKKKPKDPVASCAICRFFPFFFSLSGFFLFHQRDIGEKFVCNMFMLLTCSSADKEEKGEKKRKKSLRITSNDIR